MIKNIINQTIEIYLFLNFLKRRMIMMAYSIFDIIVGIALANSEMFGDLLIWIVIIGFIKSLTSIIGGLLAGFFFDILGWLDLISAISLLFGWSIPFLWQIMILKGIFSFLMGFGR